MSQKFQLVKARVPKGSVYHVLTLPETSGNPAGWPQPVRALRRQWRQLQFAAPGSWHAFVGTTKRQDQLKRKEYKDEQKNRDLDDESKQDEFHKRYGGDKGNALSLFDARNEHNVRGVHNYPGPSVLFVLDPVTSTMNVLPVESFVNMTPFVYTKQPRAGDGADAAADGAASNSSNSNGSNGSSSNTTSSRAAADDEEQESEQRPLGRFHRLGEEEFKQQKSKARLLVSKDYVPVSMQIASMRTARALGDNVRDLDGGRPKGGRGRRGGDDDGDDGDGDGFGRRRRRGRRGGDDDDDDDDDDGGFGGGGGGDGYGSESDADPERDGELLDEAVEAGVDRDDIFAFDGDDAADDSERRFLKYAAEGRKALAAESAATKARKAQLVRRMRDRGTLDGDGGDDGGEQGEDPDYDYEADQDVLMTDLLDTMDDKEPGSDEDGDGDGDGDEEDEEDGAARADGDDVLLDSDEDDDEGGVRPQKAKRPVATSPSPVPAGAAGPGAAAGTKRPRSESPAASSPPAGAADAKKMRSVSPALDSTEDSIRRRLSVCGGRMRATELCSMFKHTVTDTKALVAIIRRIASIEKINNETWVILRK